MSLKVVLADESSTIKKVFQLALQDFAVEVFTAHSGEDVVEICQKHEPDIIFIDTLLQKKSGYKVCADLKKNPRFNSTPIVLMWSSFVELDKDKFLACKAESHIEKPFEVQALRNLVKSLVPQTNDQEISDFLQMPDLDLETQTSTVAANHTHNEQEELEVNPLEEFTTTQDQAIDLPTHDSPGPFQEIGKDDFEQVNLNVRMESKLVDETPVELDDQTDTDPAWVTKTLDTHKQRQQLSPDLDETDGFFKVSELEDKINTVVNEQIKISNTRIKQFGPEIFIDDESKSGVKNTTPDVPQLKNISEDDIERIVLKHATPIIEKAVWRIVPEVAAQLVEKELKRLLSQSQQGSDTY